MDKIVPLKELENDNALLFYKSSTRKFGTFKVIDYSLGIIYSPFLKMVLVFHVNVLKPFQYSHIIMETSINSSVRNSVTSSNLSQNHTSNQSINLHPRINGIVFNYLECLITLINMLCLLDINNLVNYVSSKKIQKYKNNKIKYNPKLYNRKIRQISCISLLTTVFLASLS
ncbi:hypothetical protein H8356DRAFT_1344558 [Neocallimastix lanati (nom. inval.)]|nr:hypothetical protein H8356DRAFT_1344558 [Neocallimastix sp. JGI-2020a]